MRHNTIKTLTIVTNQGDVQYISKCGHFDSNGVVELMRVCQEKCGNNINKCIDLCIDLLKMLFCWYTERVIFRQEVFNRWYIRRKTRNDNR